jgi:hypothetical protein
MFRQKTSDNAAKPQSHYYAQKNKRFSWFVMSPEGYPITAYKMKMTAINACSYLNRMERIRKLEANLEISND